MSTEKIKLPERLEAVQLDDYYSTFRADGEHVNFYSDARFIAELANRYNSQPALLAACELALRRLERLGAEDEKETVGPCPACDAIRAALKQAGGEI